MPLLRIPRWTMRQYRFVCDDRRSERIEELASRYGITQQEVIEQLVDVGLEELDRRG